MFRSAKLTSRVGHFLEFLHLHTIRPQNFLESSPDGHNDVPVVLIHRDNHLHLAPLKIMRLRPQYSRVSRYFISDIDRHFSGVC